jgi:hypothetical protein
MILVLSNSDDKANNALQVEDGRVVALLRVGLKKVVRIARLAGDTLVQRVPAVAVQVPLATERNALTGEVTVKAYTLSTRQPAGWVEVGPSGQRTLLDVERVIA